MLNEFIYLIGALTTIICIVMCFVLFIVCRSRNNNGERIVLNNKTTERPWTLGTWFAGVFVAGMGVGMMYAPGDLVGYINEGLNPLESVVMMSMLSGAPVWALYSIMGLWYMKHMDSRIGKIAAILSTILGMAISLWTGMNTVAKFVGLDFPGFRFLLAATTVIIAMISAKYDLLKGMSRLAFLVFILAFLAVLSTPLSDFTFMPIVGGITGNFWKEYFSGPTAASWIFWFLSWSPTVARWLAHISGGRTMREYVAGTLLFPTLLTAVWMAASWMYQDVIVSFDLASNISSFIPCVIFIISGILLMAGTLDSDCKVFTEDLELLTNGKLERKSTIPYYGLFVLFVFSLFISGIIKEPFAFNEYSSLIFMPLMLWSIVESVKFLKRKGW